MTLRHVAKAFGAVRAVIDGTIDLYAGEAHALLGENGAGKSTMVKILAGVHEPDEGEVLLDGHPVTLASPAAARDAGIAVIYQEPTLFPDLSVAENIFMGRQPLVAGRRIDRRRMLADAAALFGRLGVRLDPGRICRGLSIADQQLVEIAKALSLDARVIVMDEPTAALSATEVARLFEVVRTLRAGGCGRAVHLAPAGRGVRDLPAGHRHARRPARADQRAGRADRRRPGPRDGRPGRWRSGPPGSAARPATWS